jgi:hypothetical protein
MSAIARFVVAATVTTGVLLGAVAGAWADTPPGTTGQGTSHGGFTFIINVLAQPDGSGEGTFEYHPIVGGTDLNIHCRDFKKYVGTHTNDGAPKSIFNSTNCFGTDATGGQVHYYAHVEATDRGPGIGVVPASASKVDTLCVNVKIFPGRLHPDPVVKDCGPIQAGDIGIVLAS